MDAVSIFMTVNDLFAVYRVLEGKGEMPPPFSPFREHIEREQALFRDGKYREQCMDYYLERCRKGGEPVFCHPSGLGAMEKLRKKRRDPGCRSYPCVSPLQDRSANLSFHLTLELSHRIDGFCAAEGVSPQSLFQFALCAYLSEINGKAGEVLYLVNCCRRPTPADRRTFGCMVGSVTLRTRIADGDIFREKLAEITADTIQSYRYTGLSGVDAAFALQKMYKLSVFDHYAAFNISYLSFPPMEGREFEARWISNGRFAMGMYCVIARSLSGGSYDIFYEYRTKLHTPDDIAALHTAAVRILEKGLDAPDAPVSQLMAGVK